MTHRRALLPSLLTAAALLPMTSADDKKPSFYPPTKVDPVVEKLYGVEVTDPYRWLEDADGPAVKEWTDKQNEFTR